VDSTLLRHFEAAAEELHFAHAAKRLGIPRSSLLLSVRALEDELGYPLFDPTAQSTVLTAEGEAFLVDAQRQLKAMAASARANVAAPGGKAKASKGKGRAPAVKGERKPGKKRQSR
jgi:DNA-binding transcriptional LysR family regulator